MANTVLREYHIGTNDRLEPRESTDKTALGVLLIRLIMLEPGTDPVRPEMGIGISSRYRYMHEDSLEDLKTDLSEQINKYLLPYTGNISVDLRFINKELHFRIAIGDITYNFVTEEQEDNKVTVRQLLNYL